MRSLGLCALCLVCFVGGLELENGRVSARFGRSGLVSLTEEDDFGGSTLTVDSDGFHVEVVSELSLIHI